MVAATSKRGPETYSTKRTGAMQAFRGRAAKGAALLGAGGGALYGYSQTDYERRRRAEIRRSLCQRITVPHTDVDEAARVLEEHGPGRCFSSTDGRSRAEELRPPCVVSNWSAVSIAGCASWRVASRSSASGCAPHCLPLKSTLSRRMQQAGDAAVRVRRVAASSLSPLAFRIH